MGLIDNIKIRVSGVLQAPYNYKIIVLKPNITEEGNILIQEMLSESNTKYVIRWNYDLNNLIIEIPPGCIIEFDGGSFSNGTLICNNTIILYNLRKEDVLNNVDLLGTFIINPYSFLNEDTDEHSKFGLFRDKPSDLTDEDIGFMYFCTDRHYPIWWGGNNIWYNALGVPVGKLNAELSWTKNSIDYIIGASNTLPTLLNPHNLTITYSSSNISIATINDTGVVTVNNIEGNTSITATFNGNEDYNPQNVSYKLNVILATSDYYVGWATGNASSFTNFRSLTAEQLLSMATPHNKVITPSYTKMVQAADIVGDRLIFFLMWRDGSAPTGGTFYGGLVAEPLIASSFTDSNVFNAQRSNVTIDENVYHVAGMRLPFEVGNYFTVNF